jgi:hypothetical protein
MPSSKKKTLSRRSIKRKTTTKRTKTIKTKTIKTKTIKKVKKTKSKRKTILKRKLNSQAKIIEYPDYQSKSELVGKDLRNTVVHGAYMKNTNLSGAKLHGTKFVDCNFINVNFDHAYVDPKTEFVNCTFKHCKTDMIKYVGGATKAQFDTLFTTSEA